MPDGRKPAVDIDAVILISGSIELTLRRVVDKGATGRKCP
jgi:hypothetical protein